MAKHEIVIHENTSASKETAPYLGSYIAKEQVRIAAFASALSAKCGLPAIQVEAILTGAFDIIEELEAESLVRIHTDLGVVCGVITGSFPTSDAPFDPEKNALELALRLDESIRLALADTVPAIATDGDLTKLRVDNAMDVEAGKPYNLIHGQGVFRVAGFNMVLDDEGAAAFLANALGTTFPLVIDEVVSKQLFMAHTAALLEPGDYKLVVKSRAGDAEGPLQTAFRRVKYLKVIDLTTITNVHRVSDPNVDKVTMGYEVEILGTHLDMGDVKVKWQDEGEPKSLTLSDDFISSREADKIVTTENWWPSTTITSGSEVTFEVNGVEHAGVLVQG